MSRGFKPRSEAMQRRVVVTGIGAITPLGDDSRTLYRQMCEGRTALKPLARSYEGELPNLIASELEWFEARTYLEKGNLRPLDRTAELCASAAGLALESSGWDRDRVAANEVGLVLGTMFGSMRTISAFDRRAVVDGPSYAKPMHFANTVINAAAGQTAIWHGLRGVNATLSSGAVSGLEAIGYAADLIRRGRATALLAGGAEELCFETIYGFHRAGLLGESGIEGSSVPLDRSRRGLALGEAAGLVMLEEEGAARERGATILAEIRGHGAGLNLSQGSEPDAAAEAVANAIRESLRDAETQVEELDAAVLSVSGSVAGDRAEAAGVERALNGYAASLPVTTPKAALGETLGASGALQLICLIEAMRGGLLPGIAGLQEVDPEMPLGGASSDSVTAAISVGLVVAQGLGRKACAMVAERGRS